jgi:hypothetical protein
MDLREIVNKVRELTNRARSQMNEGKTASCAVALEILSGFLMQNQEELESVSHEDTKEVTP